MPSSAIMATSPPYTPTNSGISLAKKRPLITTNLPPHLPNKRRKPSTAGPSHLRQQSFPPDYSPSIGGSLAATPRDSRSPSVESSVLGVGTPSVISNSAFSTGPKKRGRKKKVAIDTESIASAKGSRDGTAHGSLANGRAGSASVVDGQGEEETYAAEDDDGEDQGAMVEGGLMDEAAARQYREHEAMLMSALTPDQTIRYEIYRRFKLRPEKVRRLANFTLSQSAPLSIVQTIMALSKYFAGHIIERARDVQVEWLAAGERDVDTMAADRGLAVVKKEEAGVKKEEEDGVHEGGESLTRQRLVERSGEKMRGPLRPGHLREALRRYLLEREGGAGGHLGQSLGGTVQVAPRLGGRRLFR